MSKIALLIFCGLLTISTSLRGYFIEELNGNMITCSSGTGEKSVESEEQESESTQLIEVSVACGPSFFSLAGLLADSSPSLRSTGFDQNGPHIPPEYFSFI